MIPCPVCNRPNYECTCILRADSERPSPPVTGYATIRVRRQKGHGYWATYVGPDGRRHAVQSPQVYGFRTTKEAREAAKRQIELSHSPEFSGGTSAATSVLPRLLSDRQTVTIQAT